MAESKKDKEETAKKLKGAAISGAAAETVQRYGSAVKEHLVAYSGTDYENGMQLKRGLKDIAKAKVNPDYADANLKQQAGFAAEAKYTARQNAEHIIKGDGTRVINTDIKGSGEYDQLFDHIIKDKNGITISHEQMKFVGKNPEECLHKLASEKFQKYFDADATITVPSDYYNEIKVEADKTIGSLQKQLDYAEKNGNAQLAKTLKEKIKKYEKIKNSVKDSGVTNKDAMDARLNPVISTAKDSLKIAHRAGLEQVKYGAAIGGSLSLIQNSVAVIKGEKDVAQAGIDVAKDTGTAAATSYITTFSGSLIKGTMQNSKYEGIRALSTTNFGSSVVNGIIDCGMTMTKFATGKITGIECIEQMGETGVANLSATMFAAAGQLLIPIPVLGGMIGSMVGYALGSFYYKALGAALEQKKLAREERIRIEKECEQAIQLIIQYREEMNAFIEAYLKDMRNTFDTALEDADKAIWKNDIDGFIASANAMSIKLGRKPQFENYKEFESLMESDCAFRL